MRAFELGLGLFLLSLSTACGAATGLDVDARDAAVLDAGSDVGRPPVIDASLPVDAGVDACAAPCSPGATRCQSDAIETCIVQPNGCAAWKSAPCGPNR